MKKNMIRLLIIAGVLVLLFFCFAPAVVDRSANRIIRTEPLQVSQRAQELHSTLWIADMHADALLWNRDLNQRHNHGHVDIPRLIAGNVALQAFTIVSKVPWGLNFEKNRADSDMITLLAVAQKWPTKTWFSLRERALHQAQKIRNFAAASKGTLSLIYSRGDLQRYIQQRKNSTRLTAGFIGIEGSQVLEGNLQNIQVLFDAGFRMMAPTHFFDTKMGGSAHGMNKGGLTPFGRKAIRIMEKKGMLVDLAHASPATIDDILDVATRPVLVSHTGVKGTCKKTRNISDVHIKRIAENGGLIGIAFFPEAVCGDSVDAVIRAISYTVQLVGVKHVALGSDFDGAAPVPLDASRMVEITDGLLTAGFSDKDIALIMGENLQRLLLNNLPY